MLMSVFTPASSAKWLVECYKSLEAQTYRNWEWVVLVNGADTYDVSALVEKLETSDRRVKLYMTSAQVDNQPVSIGKLKGLACELARGEALVELDHDDELFPTCLEKLREAFDRGSDFAYSDGLTWSEGGGTDSYDMAHGWTFKSVYWRGVPRKSYDSFPVTARSLYEIFYAPDHVRAWTRKAYDKAGGYDPKMEVCDDHDLLCRTYLTGAKMVHIPECLYAQRKHEANTTVLRNAEIQTAQAEVGAKYLHRMVEEECRRKGLRMIDLGGAHNPTPEYETLDMDGMADITCDVTSGELFACVKPDSVGVFRASDFLEHLPPEKLPRGMNYLWACLAHGGWLLTATPSVDGPDGSVGRGAFQDPTHVSFWSVNNWRYYVDREYRKYVPELTCRFQLARLRHDWPSEAHKLDRLPYVWADLVALKDGASAEKLPRVPGIIRV